jgi:CHAD domain-containing protein
MIFSAEDSQIYISTYLAEQIQRLKAASRALAAGGDQTDDEQVHQFRVCTRRIRGILWVVRHDYRHWHCKKVRAVRHELKQVGDILGKRRELDVCLAMSKKYGLKMGRLEVERLREGGRVRSFMARRGESVITQLEKLALLLMAEPPQAHRRDSSAGLRRRLRKWQKSLPKSDHDFHKLRIFVKKLIYIFAARDQYIDPKITLFHRLLGRMHDLAVMEETLESNPEIELIRKKYRAKTLTKQRKVLKLISDVLNH